MRRCASRLLGLWRSGEQGQALTETALLCFLVLALGAGAHAVMRRHQEMREAVDFSVRSFYFVLSLPFP